MGLLQFRKITKITETKPGVRIIVVRTSNPYISIRPGDTGTVEKITQTSEGQMQFWIKWDNDNMKNYWLCLIEGIDDFLAIDDL
ncbi:MAG: hypothetical protein WBX01_14290 [Nitrososphaeraceae archaeon]